MLNSTISYVKDSHTEYPSEKYAFSPSVRYPEYQFNVISNDPNFVYEKVRESFHLLKMDMDNYGTPDWNPLGEIIRPGDTVLIKPNWIRDINLEKSLHNMDCLVTHPSVVRAVADYALIAMKGKGRLIIGDSPTYQCDFQHLMSTMHYNEMFDFYKKWDVNHIECRDFRNIVISKEDDYGKKLVGSNGVLVDLKSDSSLNEFTEEQMKDFRIYGYPSDILMESHQKNMHKYMIHEDVLNADVIINVPKPKTHRKAGITACSKNYVGINCRKEYLPHHRTGSAHSGGDEYQYRNPFKRMHVIITERYFETKHPSIILKGLKILSRVAEVLFSSDHKYDGAWYGNDTLWRMVSDLNTIVIYADKEGKVHSNPQRKFFNVCDMIVPGEKEGPLKPYPKKFGAILSSVNGVATDLFISRLMGFDYHKVKYIPYLKKKQNIDIENYVVVDKDERKSNIMKYEIPPEFYFEPAECWKGHIENRK